MDAAMDAASGDADANDAGVPGIPYVFVAGYYGAISVYSIDPKSGSLGKPTIYPTGARPSFLALAPNGKYLFASDGVNKRVLSFSVDRQTGALHKINELATGSDGPAHLSVDRTGKWVLVAHYTAGTYAVLAVDIDGRLRAVADSAPIGIQAHYIAMDRNNRFGMIACLGSDYVAIRELDASMGKLSAATVPTVPLPAGSGPRHIAFSPDDKFVYVNGETASTVSTLSFYDTTGRLEVVETVTTLPPGFTGTNTTAEIAVHPNGNYVYVSNRGDDSIARYRRNATTGTLTLLGHTKTGGKKPVSFSIDTEGRVLIAANQDSQSIAVFTIDAATGGLTAVGSPIHVAFPNYVGIFDIQ